MARFNYKSRDREGQEVMGVRDASDRFELARVLRQEGFMLLSASESDGSSKSAVNQAQAQLSKRVLNIFNRIKLIDKILFSKNLGVMIGAGLPLTRALEALSRESQNPHYKEVVADVVEQVRKGKTFSESLGTHADVFPPLYTAMVEAGEKSGQLREALTVLATQMQSDYDLRRKIRGAMMYPLIVICAMILIGVLMMIYVVPTLTQVFEDLKIDLPFSTQLIINTSKFLQNHGFLALVGFVGTVFAVRYGVHTKQGKNLIDNFTVRAPIIGPIAKKFNAARTARTLASLISSGVQVLEALDITSRIIQNHLYSSILQEAKSSIQKGETISKVFLKYEHLYPSLMGEMLAVGEETGESSKMLNEVALFYEGQVSDATSNLSTVIEPLLMVVIGGFVGFFAVSMIQPMYGISSAI
ncbi:MAG: type II secretion system F family protein [Patescibacteria group bacterium]